MENVFADKVKTVYYAAIAALMYYFLTETINLRVFVTYRHAFALVIAFSAIADFLYRPDIARGAAAAKSALVYSLPLAVTLFVSLFIWFTEQADAAIIARGLSGAFIYTNMLSFALAAAAFLYIFGERGIWYNLIAALAANLLMIVTIIAQYGFAGYFSELITLIRTFATETGDIIVHSELHELAFCLGAYLIYMIMKPKRNIAFAIMFILTLFCFLTAFKRIAIIAIIIALAFGFLLKLTARLSKKAAVRGAIFLSAAVVVLLIAYVAAIKADAFDVLEHMGIDTSGRADIYNAVDKFYKFSPAFMGRGIGFLTYQLSTNMHVGVTSVHNDFLQYFIDLGFWGYILWLLSMTVVRVCFFGSGGRTDGAITAFTLTLYLIIVSMTDNTMNYPLLTLEMAILMIGNGFNEDVKRTEMKIFGYISEDGGTGGKRL